MTIARKCDKIDRTSDDKILGNIKIESITAQLCYTSVCEFTRVVNNYKSVRDGHVTFYIHTYILYIDHTTA